VPNQEEVRAALAPLARLVAGLDLTEPERATAELTRHHPLSALAELRALLIAARDEGWLTPREAGPNLSFGRVAKPAEDLGGCSVDAVDMSGAGAPHLHPNGEVSLCFATEGDPRFVGHPEGWVAVPPGSRHVPEVTGGRMLIVYFLPGGAMVWE
jgi:hypothetical protein